MDLWMYEQMNVWMDRYMDGCIDLWMYGDMDGWRDRWICEQVGKWVGGWQDVWKIIRQVNGQRGWLDKQRNE